MEIKKVVEQLLQYAITKHASDIFLLPQRNNYYLQYRTSSGLSEYQTQKRKQALEIINYFKYAAQMDISEHRRPQVGAMIFLWQEKEYYLRLSSIGNFDDQESLVIRVIYQIDQSNYFFPEQIKQMKELAQKRGLIITSGPTGSGKTTTMYEIAKELSKNKVVMTIEDPVEVYERSFLQTQVNNEAKISYQTLLKAALRHRPDILIVGEIRDHGTARVAVDAALSGHLVLATVHAKSTLQTIDRLKGLGIEPEELINCLTAVSYQRLLPTLNGLSCLLDIASDNKLFQKGMFINWRNNLTRLKKEGRISAECYDLYQEG